jgi:serine/threonine-protein kinase
MSAAGSADAPLRTIGRYQVLGRLAIGGMAEILLARLTGPSGFERPVVIKRILPHLASTAAFVDMFVDEARIVAGIRHPNVVQVQELGSEAGELYLVLEYLDGENLGSVARSLWAREQRLPPALAAHIVAEACAGLHAAHELSDADGMAQYLVHRDVSPQNLLLTYDGQVKVLDFGIAKAADRITRTEAGQLKGKFEYMSPEQCLSKPLDRRSDIFALGVVLYELCTARRLFKRQNELETLKAICEQPVPPPSRAVPEIPPALEAVVMRALARRREDRFDTAADMRRELLSVMRTLGGDEAPEEALARTMSELFAERIEDKREMLRRCRSGSGPTHVPAAEVHTEVELPVVADDASLLRSTSDIRTGDADGAAQRRRSGGARWPWLAAGGVAALSLVAWRLAPGPAPVAPLDEAPAGEAAGVVAPGTASLPVDPAPASMPPDSASAAAETIRVELTSTPPGAVVEVDGKDAGKTPLSLQLPRGDAPRQVVLRAPGFLPLREQLVPNVDQRLGFALTAAPRPGGKRLPDTAAAAKPSAAPSSPATTRGFDRF